MGHRSPRSNVSGSVTLELGVIPRDDRGASEPRPAMAQYAQAVMLVLASTTPAGSRRWHNSLPRVPFVTLAHLRWKLQLNELQQCVAEFDAMVSHFQSTVPASAVSQHMLEAMLAAIASNVTRLSHAAVEDRDEPLQHLRDTCGRAFAYVARTVGAAVRRVAVAPESGEGGELEGATATEAVSFLLAAPRLLPHHAPTHKHHATGVHLFRGPALLARLRSELERGIRDRVAAVATEAPAALEEEAESLRPVLEAVELVARVDDDLKLLWTGLEHELGAQLAAHFDPSKPVHQPVVSVYTMAAERYTHLLAPVIRNTVEQWMPASDDDDHGGGWTVVFELYFAVMRLRDSGGLQHVSAAEWAGGELSQFVVWFEPLISHWIGLSLIHGGGWIDEAVRLDNLEAMVASSPTSSSLLDVTAMLNQIISFFVSLKPQRFERAVARVFVHQLTDVICTLQVQYSGRLLEKLGAKVVPPEAGSAGRFHVCTPLCVALNDLGRAQCALASLKAQLLESEQFAAIAAAVEELVGDAQTQLKQNIQVQIEAVGRVLSAEAGHFVAQAVQAHQASGEDVPADIETFVGPLLDWIDANLVTVADSIIPDVLTMFFEQFWHQALVAICDEVLSNCALTESGGMALMMMIGRLFYFFHQDGEGLDAAVLKADAAYARVHRLLAWANSDSDLLLAEYYLQVAAGAGAAGAATHGTLAVTVSVRQTPAAHGAVVHVRLEQAWGLAAMDRRGTSDPFVVVALLPRRAAGGQQHSYKSRTVPKTLSPTWNEQLSFELNRSPAQLVLRFQVFDANRFSEPDPIGEAALPLDQVLGASSGRRMQLLLSPRESASEAGREALVMLRNRAARDPAASQMAKELDYFYSDAHKVYPARAVKIASEADL